LRDTYIEYIPEVPEDSPDYNRSIEHDILDPKIHESAVINDPTYYPGPDGKMFIFKRNLTLYLAQTKPNKAISEHGSFKANPLELRECTRCMCLANVF
jgi:hypothetical protein